MTSTRYTVLNAEGVLGEGFTVKAKAVELAEASKGTSDVTVVTGAGTVVHTVKAKRTMKRTPQYTRLVELPADAVIPEGRRPAYTRARKNLVITHDAESGEYAVIRFTDGEVLADELATTREAGAFCKTVPLPERA